MDMRFATKLSRYFEVLTLISGLYGTISIFSERAQSKAASTNIATFKGTKWCHNYPKVFSGFFLKIKIVPPDHVVFFRRNYQVLVQNLADHDGIVIADIKKRSHNEIGLVTLRPRLRMLHAKP